MNNDEVVHVMQDAQMPRRDFLRKSILLALPAAFGGFVAPAVAAISMSAPLPAAVSPTLFTPPSRARGPATRDVRNHGARGNGTVDDTNAFQSAINALPADGGTVYVPAGTYLIDAVRSIKLRSRMHLKMHPDAKLIAKPTSSGEYNVVLADVLHDVEISGGQIVGERDQHIGTGSGEGGHGIRVRGSVRVTIRDILISKGWGDGITVGPKPVWQSPYIISQDVVIASVVCTGNRRNALSIGNVVGMRVYDSEFSNTHGTTPQCGIDVEPDGGINDDGTCDAVHIENCLISGNAKNGLQMWRRAQGVTVKNCIMQDNGVCGIFTEGAENVVLTGNTVRRNESTGAFIRKDNHNFQVSGNKFYNNYTRQGLNPREPFSLVGVNNTVLKDMRLAAPSYGSTNINVGLNHYS